MEAWDLRNEESLKMPFHAPQMTREEDQSHSEPIHDPVFRNECTHVTDVLAPDQRHLFNPSLALCMRRLNQLEGDLAGSG